MINQNRTWKRRWKILALLAVLLLGVTTLTDAQERKRSVAEIQADIDKLQIELREAREEAREEKIITAYRLLSLDADMVTTAVATLFPYPESNVPWSLTREMLVVVGSEADHALVREMFEEISKMQKQIEMNPRPPREIGSIIVGGKEIDFAAAEKAALMRSVEEATAKKRETIQTIPLEHRRVDGELASIIGDFVRGRSIGFSFSSSTNSVHLQGFPSDVAEVEALILELDKPTVEEPHLAGVPAGSPTGGHTKNYHLSLPNVPSFDAFPVFLENEPNVKIGRSDKQSNAYLVSGAVEDIQETMGRFYQLSMEEIETLAYGEMSFESYPLTGISVNAGIDATVVIRLFALLAPSIKVVHDRGTNSLFVLGRKTEHERVKEALVQLREAFTTEDWDTLPADKKAVRIYTVPIGVDQNAVTFFATTLAPDVMIVQGSSPLGHTQLALYGLKSDHAKVQAMFDKMQSAREAAGEDSSSPLHAPFQEGEETPGI